VTRRTVPPPLPPIARAASTPPTAPTGAKRLPPAPAPAVAAGPRPLVPPIPPIPTGPPMTGKEARRAARAAASRPPSGMRRVLRWALIVLAAMTLMNEFSVGRAARRVANTVSSRELETLGPAWADYQRLSGDGIGLGTSRLRRVLTQRTTTLTDRVISTYREGLKVVWEPQWRQARDMLARAFAANPGSENLEAALRYTEGHLARINGDARKAKGDEEAARQEYADAITAFREAAQLRPSWPDPFIGLSRTFVTGLGDVDRGADAINQARRLGYNPGERETAQLAGGYMERGDSLWQSARGLRGMPQERDYLTRASEAYQQALDLYTGVPAFAGVPTSVRRTQAGLQRVKGRLGEVDGSSFDLDLGPLGSVTFQRNLDGSKAEGGEKADAAASDNQTPDDDQQ
jgi:tetratricopeptide (TPR) repeat protein